MTLEELEGKVVEISALLDSLQLTVTNTSVLASVAGAVIALLSIVFSVICFFGISEFRNAKAAAKLAQAEAKKAIENVRDQTARLVAEVKQERDGLQLEYDKWNRHSKYFISAEVHYRNSKFQEALHHYTQAMDLRDDDNTKYKIARCLTYLGQADRAIQIFDSLLETDASNPVFLRGRAFAMRFDRPELSIKTLKKAHSLAYARDSRSDLTFKICNDIGLIYRDIARYEDCRDWHSKALELSPNDSVTLFFSAISYGLNGMKEDFSDTLKVADSAATGEANFNKIKPLWRDVIQWSSLADARKQKLSADLWSKMRLEFEAEYVRKTVEANLNCVVEITRVNPTLYKPEPT